MCGRICEETEVSFLGHFLITSIGDDCHDMVRYSFVGPVCSYLPGTGAGAESEARSEIPLASIIVSLLVAVRASLVTV